MDQKYEALFCVINAGFADTVMYSARKAGAAGATIIKGRGSSPREAEQMFNISVQAEKEILMMLVPKQIKDDVLREIYHGAGLDSQAQTIVFSLPVAGAIGISDFNEEEKPSSQSEEE